MQRTPDEDKETQRHSTTHEAKTMSSTDITKHRGWIQVLSKDKQFLIRHPYIVQQKDVFFFLLLFIFFFFFLFLFFVWPFPTLLYYYFFLLSFYISILLLCLSGMWYFWYFNCSPSNQYFTFFLFGQILQILYRIIVINLRFHIFFLFPFI